jgi:NTP pyrophosphatase (non-canonical NTP hydrolase)
MTTPLSPGDAHPRLSGGPEPLADPRQQPGIEAELHDMAPFSFDLYQRYTERHALYPKTSGLLYTTLGLAGEAGEVANQVKKAVRDDGGTVTAARLGALRDELGDVLWYLAAVAREAGLSLSEIASANLTKLDARKEAGTIRGSGDKR